MDFIDDTVKKAKEAIDIACKKTNEVDNLQKQKFDAAALENKKSKDFALLGEIYFNRIKDGEIDDENIANLVAEIKEKDEKIAALRAEINAAKRKMNCPACGSVIDKTSNYCNVCGAKLVFESDVDEQTEEENKE